MIPVYVPFRRRGYKCNEFQRRICVMFREWLEVNMIVEFLTLVLIDQTLGEDKWQLTILGGNVPRKR